MNVTMDASPIQTRAAIEVEHATPAVIETTLFDLITALQDSADPGDDAVVIAAVADLARTGRIRLRVPVVANN
ncbi:MAG: hypothetical protein OEU26_09965 [Candidatus Tectomicrobia bacterium]|nr:hypothetical protein [Candidatus Tectomicrobia bacterium]